MIGSSLQIGWLLDWWIIAHIAGFIVIGSTAEAVGSFRDQRGYKHSWEWWKHLLLCAGITIAWEVAEHFLSRAYPEKWSNTLEWWGNAWVIDPISNALGYWIGFLIARWSWRRNWKR